MRHNYCAHAHVMSLAPLVLCFEEPRLGYNRCNFPSRACPVSITPVVRPRCPGMHTALAGRPKWDSCKKIASLDGGGAVRPPL